MDIVEVPSPQSRYFRRLCRATALLLTGAALHLWLFPSHATSGRHPFLERLTAGVVTVAERGAVATSGMESGAIASALGTVTPPAKSVPRIIRRARRVQVLIQTVHPVVVPTPIEASPARLTNALFSVVTPAETPASPPGTADYERTIEAVSEGRPQNELPPAHEIEPVAHIVQPPPEPVAMAEPLRALPIHRDGVRRLERPSDERLVSYVLQQYREAYESLDVNAAQTVWPTVDTHALGAAFRQLAGQRVTFESCGVSVSGSGSQATARCTGQAEYVPKVGGRRAYTATGEWVFNLEKENAAWRIINANTNIK